MCHRTSLGLSFIVCGMGGVKLNLQDCWESQGANAGEYDWTAKESSRGSCSDLPGLVDVTVTLSYDVPWRLLWFSFPCRIRQPVPECQGHSLCLPEDISEDLASEDRCVGVRSPCWLAKGKDVAEGAAGKAVW